MNNSIPYVSMTFRVGDNPEPFWCYDCGPIKSYNNTIYSDHYCDCGCDIIFDNETDYIKYKRIKKLNRLLNEQV